MNRGRFKATWEGCTGGFGADNRRARRIERARLAEEARREVLEQTSPPSDVDLLLPGQCYRCGSYDCDLH